MVKENINQEVQELIRQVEANFQEGIDYKHNTLDEVHKEGVGVTSILSPRLKEYCRKKFGFPLGVNKFLNYWKEDAEGNGFYYKTRQTIKEGENRADILWRYRRKLRGLDFGKASMNCSFCQKTVFRKEGWMELLNGEIKAIGYCKVWKPISLVHFHPECAENYFVDREQSKNDDFSDIKEKILQNLEKICLDPAGCLVNAELIKNWNFEEWCEILGRGGSEELAKKGLYNIKDGNGEKIDLQAFFDWPDNWESVKKDYLEIARAIVVRVKDNPTDWEFIGKNGEEMWEMVRNKKTGLKHYNPLCITNPTFLVKEKTEIWNDIKSAINDPEFTDKNNNLDSSELENLKKIFREHNIREITFENGNLVIDYYKKKPVNEQEFCELEKYCQENGKKLITSKSLGLGIGNSNSQSNQNNHQLAIGLAVGGGIAVVILIGVTYLLASKKKNKL